MIESCIRGRNAVISKCLVYIIRYIHCRCIQIERGIPDEMSTDNEAIDSRMSSTVFTSFCTALVVKDVANQAE